MFTDAPQASRCQFTISLKDGTTAQCGRSRADGSTFCWQHRRGGGKEPRQATRCHVQVFDKGRFQSRCCNRRTTWGRPYCTKHAHDWEIATRRQGPVMPPLPGSKDNGSHLYFEDATALVFNNHWENHWCGLLKRGGGYQVITLDDSPVVALAAVRKAAEDAR